MSNPADQWTTAEPEGELQVAFQTIGPVLEKFVSVDPILVPKHDGAASRVFITKVEEILTIRRLA
jgi:RAB protein geranylgeranyltransferase component A